MTHLSSCEQVIVRTVHLKALRLHVEREHGRPFDAVFKEYCTASTQCSGVDVMLTYLFHFHRDEYDWHFQQYDPLWRPTAILGQVSNYSFLTAANTMPAVRVAVHVGQLGNYHFGTTTVSQRWDDPRFPSVDPLQTSACVQRQVRARDEGLRGSSRALLPRDHGACWF